MRLIRLLALIGLGISGYLLILKLNGTISSIAGCGGEGGCDNVLGSKWSQWFGIPVSAFSTVLYAGLIVLTFKPRGGLLRAIAILLIAAAFWFIGLQIFVIKSFCMWCCATHLVGILTAVAILRNVPRKDGYSNAPACLAALLSVAVVVLGQIFGPEPKTYAIEKDDTFKDAPLPPAPRPGEGRVISFQNGAKTFRVDLLPLLGPPDAKHVLVKYFDYTCASCLDLEGDLEKLLAKYPKDIAVIVLPTPINSACNPYLTPTMGNHQHACELARLGLAAWKASPENFPAAHKILFSRPVLDGATARTRLLNLIPAAKLDTALADPWIEEQLKANFEDFRLLTRQKPQMPKILLSGDILMHGVTRTTELFIQEVEKALDLP